MQLHHKRPSSGLPAGGKREAGGPKRAPDDTVPNQQEGRIRVRRRKATELLKLPAGDPLQNILKTMTGTTTINPFY